MSWDGSNGFVWTFMLKRARVSSFSVVYFAFVCETPEELTVRQWESYCACAELRRRSVRR